MIGEFGRPYYRPLWLVAMVMVTPACGGGLPLPTPGAIQCADNVWIEAGAKLTCPTALAFVQRAETATGISASAAEAIEFVVGYNLARFGQPKAIGLTEGADIAVIETQANSLVHEFLHLHQKSHCNWSVTHLPLFEQYQVGGGFQDDCAHVYCSSSYIYAQNGQEFGYHYSCVAN